MTRGLGRFLRRNTIALLALFLALGGTTYAASTGLISKNSVASPQVVNGSLQTKDLSRKARAALKGNRGPQGLTGPKGDKGDQGPFPSGNLPAGKTIRGTYALGAGAADSYAWDSISFGFVLSAAPIPHWIPAAGPIPAECPGTASNPQAAPGHLCVYERPGGFGNVGSRQIYDPSAPGGSGNLSSRYGAGLFMERGGLAEDFWSYGTWAVTSAAGSAASSAKASSTTP